MKKIIIVFLIAIFPLQGADFASQIKKLEVAGVPVIHASTISGENRIEEIVSRVDSELNKSRVVLLVDEKGRNSMVDHLFNHAKTNPEKSYVLFESPVLGSNGSVENRIQAKTYVRGSSTYTNVSQDFKRLQNVSSDKMDSLKTKITNKITTMVEDAINRAPNKEFRDNVQVILNITHHDDSFLAMNSLIAQALMGTRIKKLIINCTCQDSQEDEDDTSESSDESGSDIEEIDEPKDADTIKEESPKKEYWINKFLSAHSRKIIGSFSVFAFLGFIFYQSIYKN